MASVDSLLNTSVAGVDSFIKLTSADNDAWTIEADSTTDQLLITRNGTTVFRVSAYGAGFRRVQPKTASYTLVAGDAGSLFTTTGASGAITFTLPAASSVPGFTADFVNTVDQNMIIAAPADTMVAHNDATATSVAFQTSAEKIGGAARVVSDGTKWLVFLSLAFESQTVTIA